MYNEYENLSELENIMTNANEFVVERVKKLNKLYELGINPYPYNYDYNEATHTKEICDNFESIHEEKVFSLAGRVMLLRRMGNATFCNITDEKGNIQIFFSKKLIGVESYNVLKLIDSGDIIGVTGTVFKTQTGEITIRASKFETL
jgi:lysyl-tRNA synthetase class 2